MSSFCLLLGFELFRSLLAPALSYNPRGDILVLLAQHQRSDHKNGGEAVIRVSNSNRMMLGACFLFCNDISTTKVAMIMMMTLYYHYARVRNGMGSGSLV